MLTKQVVTRFQNRSLRVFDDELHPPIACKISKIYKISRNKSQSDHQWFDHKEALHKANNPKWCYTTWSGVKHNLDRETLTNHATSIIDESSKKRLRWFTARLIIEAWQRTAKW